MKNYQRIVLCMSKIKIKLKWLVLIVAVTFLVLVVSFIIPNYTFRRIISSSMHPTIKNGDIVIIHKCNIAETKVGDIICYRDFENNIDIVHRVESKMYLNNTITLYTKGDNNDTRDTIKIDEDNFIGVVVNFD